MGDSAVLRPTVLIYEIEFFFQSTFFVATQLVSFWKRKYNSIETCAVHSIVSGKNIPEQKKLLYATEH